MACTTMSISTRPILREQKTLRRSQSNRELSDLSGIRRSQSDPQFRCSLNPIVASTEPKLKTSHSMRGFPFQISVPISVGSILTDPDMHKEMNLVDHSEESEEEDEQQKRANWMERVLEVRKNYRSRQHIEQEEGNEDDDPDEGGCDVDYSLDEEVTYDQETFSKLLDKVSWSDTKLFAQLAFLCNMAYVIPEIKAEDLRRSYELHFVTSSLVKKAEASNKLNSDQDSTLVGLSSSSEESNSEKAVDTIEKRPIRSSVAYEIAASAASYVHSRAKGLLSLGNKKSPTEDTDVESVEGGQNQMGDSGCSPSRVYNSGVAVYVATSTMTSVVAAEETAKQEAAKALQSLHSSPCEWFICDDPSTYTRCFVIQGSDSLASWQANLFFEPCEFEGTDVLVHRGIYEAAKGIYEQFKPEIVEHLNTYGERAKLRFTGHSLGGSLSLLVNMMLVARGDVKPSTLLPVVTFGSPFVFCGGRRILDQLGLDESHIRSVMMHRDIVPRAFSCNYPNHVAQILKRLTGSFRSHPCLNKNKMLYTPLGQLFILQPDGKSSPPHPLLPQGSAFYALDKSQPDCYAGVSSALSAFLNSPHPLETLSDPTAYGSDGTILRDHDSSNYLKAVNGVLRQHTKSVVERSRRERLYRLWLPLTSQTPHSWSHQQNLESLGFAKKEVVTGV